MRARGAPRSPTSDTMTAAQDDSGGAGAGITEECRGRAKGRRGPGRFCPVWFGPVPQVPPSRPRVMGTRPRARRRRGRGRGEGVTGWRGRGAARGRGVARRGRQRAPLRGRGGGWRVGGARRCRGPGRCPALSARSSNRPRTCPGHSGQSPPGHERRRTDKVRARGRLPSRWLCVWLPPAVSPP